MWGGGRSVGRVAGSESCRCSMAAWDAGQRGKGVKDSNCADSEPAGPSLTSASRLSSYSINPYAVESEHVVCVHVQTVSDRLVYSSTMSSPIFIPVGCRGESEGERGIW